MVFRPIRRLAAALIALSLAGVLWAQVIEFEANGQKYQTLSHKGLTVIVTHMPNHVSGFGLIQVSIANGSDFYWTVQPEDFSYVRGESAFSAISANAVVDLLLTRANHNDVEKLVSAYENNLYGIPNMRSNNGYEQRRQGAMSFGINAKLKAAATASAIALAQARLGSGQSTDGAVFFPLPRDLKTLAGGHIVFRSGGETFDFNMD
jgi:hypothetical protein